MEVCRQTKGGGLKMRLSCIGSGSNGNSYALMSDDEILLLDAGLPIVKAVMPVIDFQISKISGVLVTHSHS